MKNISFEELQRPASFEDEIIGTSRNGKVEKNGRFYHVITQIWNRSDLFTWETARYRQNLLCRLCADRNITILFSVTMPSHTHEVLMTPDFKLICEVYRILNTNVSKMIKKTSASRIEGWTTVFNNRISYVMVKDIIHLFYLGMYIYSNPAYLQNSNRKAPDSCFWMFERNYFVEPYSARIYEKLFGFTPLELLEIYKTNTRSQVLELANQYFATWTEEDNRRLFFK